MKSCFLGIEALFFTLMLATGAFGKTMEATEADSKEHMVTGEVSETEGKEEMKLMIGETPVDVEWEKNTAVEELKKMVSDSPVTVDMSMYGGFEQVGSLGKDLPASDEQTVTESGDIVLYAGSNIVIFYGSNSWAYTRLGKVTDKTAGEMAELLGNGDTTLTISMESSSMSSPNTHTKDTTE